MRNLKFAFAAALLCSLAACSSPGISPYPNQQAAIEDPASAPVPFKPGVAVRTGQLTNSQDFLGVNPGGSTGGGGNGAGQ